MRQIIEQRLRLAHELYRRKHTRARAVPHPGSPLYDAHVRLTNARNSPTGTRMSKRKRLKTSGRSTLSGKRSHDNPRPCRMSIARTFSIDISNLERSEE